MSGWTKDELSRIGTAEEVQIAGRRRDGTLRNPVTVWVVRVGDDLYLRSVGGRDGSWFRGVEATHEGRVEGGGVAKDVRLVDADPNERDQIDDAYRAKYRRYAGRILNSVLTAQARLATVKVEPSAGRS